MVKYYLNTGDQLGSKMFSPYVWEGNGFGELIDKISLNKEYGKGLKLLLIKYYIEGKFSGYMPIEPKINNYMSKSKDIAVDIAVTKELFHDRNEFERREFIVDSTLNAVKLVRDKLKKKKLDIDFEALINDLKEASEEFLKKEEPYHI
jgi:hypothetical protein